MGKNVLPKTQVAIDSNFTVHSIFGVKLPPDSHPGDINQPLIEPESMKSSLVGRFSCENQGALGRGFRAGLSDFYGTTWESPGGSCVGGLAGFDTVKSKPPSNRPEG